MLKTIKQSLISDCLEMYTALRLIIIGCQFSGLETLGMAVVDDPLSAWCGHIPVPRMVKNQVNHLLELRMVELDRKITDALSRLPRDRRLWIVGTLAVFLLLHIRELDAGRNIYWARYKDSVRLRRALPRRYWELLTRLRLASGYTRLDRWRLLTRESRPVIRCSGIFTAR